MSQFPLSPDDIDPIKKKEFEKILNELKEDLYHFENDENTRVTHESIATNMRKALECFMILVHLETEEHHTAEDSTNVSSEQGKKQKSPPNLRVQIEHFIRDSKLDKNTQDYLTALFHMVRTIGNSGAHYHQEFSIRRIDHENIDLIRVAFFKIIESSLSKILQPETYDFLKLNTHQPLKVSTSSPLHSSHIQKKHISLLKLLIISLFCLSIWGGIHIMSTPSLDSSSKYVVISTTSKLIITLIHQVSSADEESLIQAAQTYAKYRTALEVRNPSLADSAFPDSLKCYYSQPNFPKHEFFRTSRWKSRPQKRVHSKHIYLKTASSYGKGWVLLSTAEDIETPFGVGQIFVIEQGINTQKPQRWYITAEYGLKKSKCAPKVRKQTLHWK